MSDAHRLGAHVKKRIEQWLKFSVLPPIGAVVIRGLGRTMAIEAQGYELVEAWRRQGGRCILSFWHAQQLMVALEVESRGIEADVLISQHQDGEIIARIISRFGHRAVRGSSTRGGALALRALIRLGRVGADLAVTPDGPKGPRQVVKLGVVQLAKATGLPIVPLVFCCSKKKLFASWDRFMVPFPWSRGLYLWGAPIWIPRDADEQTLEAARLELETLLNRLTDQAEEAVTRRDER